LSGVALSTDIKKVADVDADLDSALLDGRAPLVAQGMQITPAGNNRFKKMDTAVCYVEVYEPMLRAAGPVPPSPAGVTVQVRLIDAKTGEPRTDSGAMDVSKLAKPGNPVIPVAFRLQVEALPAGSYIAEIKAADSKQHTIARKVPFEVVE